MKEEILQILQKVVKKLTPKDIKIELSIPNDSNHGDYATNVAFQLSKLLGKTPLQVAQELVEILELESKKLGTSKIEAVAPGFINFSLSQESLSKNMQEVLDSPEKVGRTSKMKNKKIMVEFAHPNTHKELHIGHMRTLTTGESLARIFAANGAEVFRANYQGDIGPHVAKAIYGVQKMMEEQHFTLGEIEKWSFAEKAHFLGQGYARGSKDYESGAKEEIDSLNVALYKREPQYQDIYQLTRQWSLDYYDEFYKRFYTKFNKLFFEGDLDKEAVKVVKKNVGNVFTQDVDGSIVFHGEPYGLHTRVFVTQKGTPTYEGKEVALGFAEYAAFPFDLKIHVVASEQTGYFKVVFKAMELIDPEKFEGHEYHLPMGMVQLVGRKMSSRTGDVLTVDELLYKVKEAAEAQFQDDKLNKEEKEKVLEEVTIGSVKYSILRSGVTQNALFDIEKSVSLDGNSGPYAQYAYTRTQSILHKAGISNVNYQMSNLLDASGLTVNAEEALLLRKLVHFPEIVEQAATTYSPNVVTEYLFELAQLFNNFYQKYRIVNALTEEEKQFRLSLTAAVGIVLKQGLNLLGIQAPEKM